MKKIISEEKISNCSKIKRIWLRSRSVFYLNIYILDE